MTRTPGSVAATGPLAPFYDRLSGVYRMIRAASRNQMRRLACRCLPYGAAVFLVNVYLRTPAGRRRADSRAAVLFRILDESGVEYDRRETAARTYMLRALFPWAYCRFTRCSAAELERWVSVDGLEHLDAASRGGRGVLVVGSHFGPGHMVECILAERGYQVHAVRASGTFVRKFAVSENNPRLAREIYISGDASGGLMQTTTTVRNLLRGGKVVKAALDGGAGSGGVDLELMRHRRHFRTGLPLIAGLTGAAIVPVFVSLEADGRIRVRVDRPFAERAPKQAPVDYAEEVVRDYVTRLQSFCETEPGNVDIKRLPVRVH